MLNVIIKKEVNKKEDNQPHTQIHMDINYKGMAFTLSNIESILITPNVDDSISVFMTNDLFEFSVGKGESALVAQKMIEAGFEVEIDNDVLPVSFRGGSKC